MANRKEILAQYLKVNSDLIEYLGSGNFAEAFLYKNRVYKITRDLDDYLMATKLVKEGKRFDCFVKVYKTRIFNVLENNRTQELYLIVSEHVTPLDKSPDRTAKRIWEELCSENDTRDILSGEQEELNFPLFLNRTPLVEHLYNEMDRILKLYKRWGMKCWDNPPRNLAYIDGKIKIFDFGFSALKGKGNYRYSKRKTVTFNFKKEIPKKDPIPEPELESTTFRLIDLKSSPLFTTGRRPSLTFPTFTEFCRMLQH
jgi:hypothetical protein